MRKNEIACFPSNSFQCLVCILVKSGCGITRKTKMKSRSPLVNSTLMSGTHSKSFKTQQRIAFHLKDSLEREWLGWNQAKLGWLAGWVHIL